MCFVRCAQCERRCVCVRVWVKDHFKPLLQALLTLQASLPSFVCLFSPWSRVTKSVTRFSDRKTSRALMRWNSSREVAEPSAGIDQFEKGKSSSVEWMCWQATHSFRHMLHIKENAQQGGVGGGLKSELAVMKPVLFAFHFLQVDYNKVRYYYYLFFRWLGRPQYKILFPKM